MDCEDRIHVLDLRVRTILGVHPEERQSPREVIINITIHADLRSAATHDRLDETVDYDRISRRVTARAESSEFLLIETLASAVADCVLESAAATACRVWVEKPGVPAGARAAAVELFRKKT